jgi:hypothetical protein
MIPTLISNSGYLQNLTRNPNLERKKIKKKKFLGLNRPFIEVAHFVNTMAIDLEILSDSNIKIQNTQNDII